MIRLDHKNPAHELVTYLEEVWTCWRRKAFESTSEASERSAEGAKDLRGGCFLPWLSPGGCGSLAAQGEEALVRTDLCGAV